MMKLKNCVFLALICSMFSSCLLFGRSYLEIRNKTSDDIVILKITERFPSSQKVTIPPNTSKLFKEGSNIPEQSSISLLYKNKQYLIETGYIQDYREIAVEIEDPGKYTVFASNYKLYSSELEK